MVEFGPRTKYIVLAIVDAGLAFALYLVGHSPVLAEGTIIGGLLIAAPLAIHDLEAGDVIPAVVTDAQLAQIVAAITRALPANAQPPKSP